MDVVLEIHRNVPGVSRSATEKDWSPDFRVEGRFRYPAAARIAVWSVLALVFLGLAAHLSASLFGYAPDSHGPVGIVLEAALGLLLGICGLVLRWVQLLEREIQRGTETIEGLQEIQAVLRKRNRELEMQSRTDPLTGVGNRLLLAETLEFESQRCDRYGDALSLSVVEIGGLRKMRVGLGRVAVDETLRLAATLIQGCAKPSDWLFRWGDGEFVILWIGADERTAQERVDVVERALREGFTRSGLDMPVSIGVTTYCGGEGGDHLLSRADQAKSEVPRGGVRFLRAPSSCVGAPCPN